jgi:hypothetical protein
MYRPIIAVLARRADIVSTTKLPDFPNLKHRLMERHVREVRAKVDAQMPVVSKIRSVRFHEGNSFSVERDDGIVESQAFIDVRTPIEISRHLEFNETVQSLKEKTEKLTLDVAAQIEKVFFERFHEITSEVGNAIDMKGAPFTLEAYLDSMERVDIDFDMFGFPEFPTQVMHPSMVATYEAEMARCKDSAALRERAESIIERKRKDYRDREGRRRLVT